MRSHSWLFGMLSAIALSVPALAQPHPDKYPDFDPRGPDDRYSEQRRDFREDRRQDRREERREFRREAERRDVETSREWLSEARDAIRRGQPRQANEFLERAATRLLSRSTEPSRAGEPMRDRTLGHIADAREALYNRDPRTAMRDIDQAIGTL